MGGSKHRAYLLHHLDWKSKSMFFILILGFLHFYLTNNNDDDDGGDGGGGSSSSHNSCVQYPVCKKSKNTMYYTEKILSTKRLSNRSKTGIKFIWKLIASEHFISWKFPTIVGRRIL